MQNEDKEKAEAEEFLQPVVAIKVMCLERHKALELQEKNYARLFQKFVDDHQALPFELRHRNLFRVEDAVNQSLECLNKVNGVLQVEINRLREMDECIAALASRFHVPCRVLISECCRLNLEAMQIIVGIQAAADVTVCKLQLA